MTNAEEFEARDRWSRVRGDGCEIVNIFGGVGQLSGRTRRRGNEIHRERRKMMEEIVRVRK